MEALSALKAPCFVIDEQLVRQHIAERCRVGRDSQSVESRAALYYSGGGPLLWVDRLLCDSRSDTLISRLYRLTDIGISEQPFRTSQTERDLQQLRRLDVASAAELNQLVARVELNLTKAWLRYASGHRYGFVNPRQVFNTLDPQRVDSTGQVKQGYKPLFDLRIERPTAHFFDRMLQAAHSLDDMLCAIDSLQPRDALYQQLLRQWPTADGEGRKRIACNMERCRWRLLQPITGEGKYVVVNIPAFHLYAHGGDTLLHMRIGCGQRATKTPQLDSEIEYMQVNPEWGIPQSIIDSDVARHAGDSSYFARHRYYIAERSTGQKVDVRSVSRGMLLSGRYRVNQEGGPGNSLGRLIFRFKNNFSVYFHDTSTPGFFRNAVRSVSHGCVRIQRPFDFACFLLDDADDWTLDRIRISIDMAPETEQGRTYVRRHATDEPEERERALRMIRYLPVRPRVPIYIIYYTIYPDADGALQSYPDIYGFDDVLWQRLNPSNV